MSKIIFGSARIDENGKASGGAAGDQTGKEVSTQAGYIHSKGWRVFRIRNTKKAHKVAYAMSVICANSCVGYDQLQRLTLYNESKKCNFDPAKVAVKVETDCSAAVRVCLAYAGYMLTDFYTGNEAEVLKSAGLSEVEFTGLNDLHVGDILVTKTKGHTVVVLQSADMTAELLADYVINGCWGNYPWRKKALTEAGYDYEAVRAAVNERCKA